MNTFLHSGGCGDVIYSLPLVKRMGGGVLYLKQRNKYNSSVNQYEQLKDLLLHQHYIHDVREYPNTPFFVYDKSINIDVDLDRFRNSPALTSQHIIKSYFDIFNIQAWDWGDTWIKVNDVINIQDKPFVIINRTHRYRNPSVNWVKIYVELVNEYDGNVFFVGLDSEFEDFAKTVKDMRLQRIVVPDLLHALYLISESEGLWCNPSVCLTLAQSIGQHVNVELAAGHNNVIIGNFNENILV